MKRTISVVVALLLTSGLLVVHPAPASAKRTRVTTGLLRALRDGSVTVDQLVAATADRCQCAPPRAEGLTAGIAEPMVNVGSNAGAPGELLTFTVFLTTAGAQVAGVQADIAFDPLNTPVAATGSGRPDCTVNPDINKQSTAFAFQPPGCVGASCTAFRALVLSLNNVDPIPDGSALYTCNVAISPGATPGTYPLVISNVGMSTPQGQAIPSSGTDGAINVIGGPSPTPTATPPPTATATSPGGGPTSKEQCKNGGWRTFTVPRTFKNQGDCIQFVNTGK
jgi:hypothetical protein